MVSFSKRKSGLVKKAYELSILCGAHVAVIVFSPAKKSFSFIHPSVSSVLDRYLSSQSSQPHYYSQGQLLNHPSTSDAAVSNLSSQLAELTAVLEASKNRREALKERVHALAGNACVDGDMSQLGWNELNDLKMQLNSVMADISTRADELCMDGCQFMDATAIQSNLVHGYCFPCNDGAMLLPTSSGLVSNYAGSPMSAYPSVDFSCKYDGHNFA